MHLLVYELYVKITLHDYITRQLLKSSASKYSVSLGYKRVIYYNHFLLRDSVNKTI